MLLFPAALQFGPALSLMVPLGIAALGRMRHQPVDDQPGQSEQRTVVPFHPICGLQGLSSDIAGLAGSLGMGLTSQLLGLPRALPVQILAFVAFAWILGRRPAPGSS